MKPGTPAGPGALYDVIRLVRPLYKVLEASVALELAQSGVTIPQRAILEQLLEQGPATVPAIGRSLIAPRQFVQKTANELMALGLVERRDNAAHKRSDLLCLTPAGEAAIARIKDRETAVMRPIARALEADDLATTRRVMAAMVEAFAAHNAEHIDRKGASS